MTFKKVVGLTPAISVLSFHSSGLQVCFGFFFFYTFSVSSTLCLNFVKRRLVLLVGSKNKEVVRWSERLEEASGKAGGGTSNQCCDTAND